MENEAIFCVGFYYGFRSTQPTVVIKSYYQTYVKLGNLAEKFGAVRKPHQRRQFKEYYLYFGCVQPQELKSNARLALLIFCRSEFCSRQRTNGREQNSLLQENLR